MARALVILAFVGSVAVLSAQGSAPAVSGPAFEVASVKPNTSGSLQQAMMWATGSFSATNMPLRLLIAQAHGIVGQFQTRFRVVGGPEALLAERYDIQARLPQSTPEGPHFEMLRSLLAERFNMRVHRESRPTPVYALTLAREDRRLGSDLRPSSIDCTAERQRAQRNGQPFNAETAPRDAKGRPICWGTTLSDSRGARTLTAVGPLSDLVRSIEVVVDKPVTDATALSGRFEWHLVFAGGAPIADVPAVFAAVEEQLGLKLQAQTAPFEVLVIDSVEPPTPD